MGNVNSTGKPVCVIGWNRTWTGNGHAHLPSHSTVISKQTLKLVWWNVVWIRRMQTPTESWCFSDRASWIDYILITNLMRWLLFIHKILFSSTCFELQVFIFRRIQLYTCSTWGSKHVEENNILWIDNNQRTKLVINMYPQNLYEKLLYWLGVHTNVLVLHHNLTLWSRVA